MSKDKHTDTNMQTESFADILDNRFTQYAFMSLEDRALPDARDGLKPSQRRVLVAMNDLKLAPNSSNEKSAKICGDTSGNYHPHGEAVVYPTMYRLVQPWVMRYPLVLGQGNFGNVDGDPPAAMRYTEARLSQYGSSMLQDLSSNCVKFQLNYNEKRQEPTILPSVIPNLLVNGCEGIAVGWATKMLPHNLREVVEVIKAYIKNPKKLTPEDVLKIMPGPDFPTGGKLLSQDGVLEYYRTGHGSIKIEGQYEIVPQKGGKSQIIVTELPYQTSPAQFCMDVEKLVDSQATKMDGLQDLKNLSSKKTGVKVVIDIAKNGNPNLIVNNLLKHTCLRKSTTVNATVLIDGKVMPDTPILTLVETFVKHRKDVLTNKFNAEREAANKRIHILEGLIGITDRIDAVIAVIRNSDSPEEAEQTLIKKKFVQSQEQAKAVLAITLRQLTKLESDKLLTERNNLTERIAWLEKVLGKESELLKVVVKEQEELAKKMGDDRRTELALDASEIADEDLIPDEKMVITLTGEGYIRSIPVDDYRVQGRGGKGARNLSNKTENPDNITEMFEVHSKDTVLFFTNKGLVYQRRAFEVPRSGKTNKGLHVSNLLDLDSSEYVTNMISLKEGEKGHLVIITKKGFIKKTNLTEYETNRKKAGLIAIKLNPGDEAAFAFLSKGGKDVFLITAAGYGVRYNEKIVKAKQGRNTKGVRALKLDPKDQIASAMIIDPKENLDIMVVTKGGFGKKTTSSEFPTFGGRTARGSSVINKKGIEKNGEIAGACCLKKNDTILVMTSSGKCIRLGASDVRNTGRTTMGVKIVKLDSMDSVTKITKLTSEEIK